METIHTGMTQSIFGTTRVEVHWFSEKKEQDRNFHLKGRIAEKKKRRSCMMGKHSKRKQEAYSPTRGPGRRGEQAKAQKRQGLWESQF